MPVNQENYVYATAVIAHTVIKKAIETSYPDLSMRDHDEMFISIIDRIARMRGWAIRREVFAGEEE